jgi:hypothetical protein
MVRPGGAQLRGNSVAVATQPQGCTLCVRVLLHEWALSSMRMMWRQRRAARESKDRGGSRPSDVAAVREQRTLCASHHNTRPNPTYRLRVPNRKNERAAFLMRVSSEAFLLLPRCCGKEFFFSRGVLTLCAQCVVSLVTPYRRGAPRDSAKPLLKRKEKRDPNPGMGAVCFAHT